MKTILIVLLSAFLLSPVLAADYNFIRVPAPANPVMLEDAGFQLFHRAGDYWFGSLPDNAVLPAGGNVLCEIDPTKGEFFRVLLADPADADILAVYSELLLTHKNEAVIRAKVENLSSLPPLNAQWIRISTNPKPMTYSGIEVPQTDQFHPMVINFVEQVSQAQYTEYVQTLQDFVTRNAFTPQCDSAGVWIYNQFESMGLDVSMHPFEYYGQTEYNIVGELVGAVHPDSIVFVTGHYDATVGSPWSPEPVAPGADDNGSGVACVLECARILSQYNFEKTIRFVAFSGEETGLWGSEAYVEDLVAANADVIGCFNYDMIAWSGSDPLPPDLVIHTDYNPLSMAMADKIEEAVLTFVPVDVEPVVTIDPGAQGSDHASFWDVGYPATEGIEAPPWGPEFNPYYHSVNDLIIYCDLEYAANCTRAAIAALGEYAGPIPDSGPSLSFYSIDFGEISGNGNNMPDAGEELNLIVTLINVGVEQGTNISANLLTSDPYLTVLQANTTYPDLNPTQSSAGNQPFEIAISSSCPDERDIYAELEITADGGYECNMIIMFVSGDPVFLPSGPDGYGYYAYDMYDGEMAPDFDWLETAPIAGGSGNALTLSTNQTTQVNLPFTFRFYGQDFDLISVCANGWLCFGATTSFIPVNLSIPHTVEPNNMVAPFWDSIVLDGQSQISTQYFASDHKFVIEWYDVRLNLVPSAQETFEVTLYDPAYYSTQSGNGEIIMSYLDVAENGWCSVGIENGTGTIGLQYAYNNNYNVNSYRIESEFALKFSTDVYINPNAPEPFELLSPADGDTVFTTAVEFIWESAIDPNPGQVPTYDVWIDTLPNMSTKWLVGENLSDTTLTSSVSIDNKLYYWNVLATDVNTPGTWATKFLFKTYFPEPPSHFSLTEPANGANIVSEPTTFAWEESIDPDPGDIVTYTLWFVSGGDSVGYEIEENSVDVYPDTVNVLATGTDAVWYVTANCAFPDTSVESNERFTFTPNLSVKGDRIAGIPDHFFIDNNYPNPFNPATAFQFGLPADVSVSLIIYDISGRQTAVLTDEPLQAGYHRLEFNAGNLASGVYFARFEAGDFVRIQKLLLIK